MKSSKKLSGTRTLLACALIAIGAASAWAVPARIYKVTIADDIVGGSVTASKTSELAAREKINLSVTPEKGYEFDSVSVTSVNDGKAINPSISSDGQFTFKMPKGDVTVSATFLKPVATKAKPDAVGDVVLNDGTAISFENAGKMSRSQKDKAMAVIFYIGTECSNDGRKRMLGVGLYEDSAFWHPASKKETGILGITIGIGDDIDTIKVKLSLKTKKKEEADKPKKKKFIEVVSEKDMNYDTDSYVFEGDKDGSDNLEQISAFLKKKGFPDDTAPVVGAASFSDENYPAFYFAKNYKDYKRTRTEQSEEEFNALAMLHVGKVNDPVQTTVTSNVGEAFKDGWYLPTIVELFQIWKNKSKVNEALASCGGSQFNDRISYVSSSQYENVEVDGMVYKILTITGTGDVGPYVYSLTFGTGICSSTLKDSGGQARAIREF